MNSNTKLHNKSSFRNIHPGEVDPQEQGQHLGSGKAGHRSDIKLGLTLDIDKAHSLRNQNNSVQRSNLSMMSPDFGRNGASQVADFEQFVQKNVDHEHMIISGQRNFEVGSIQLHKETEESPVRSVK